MRCPDCNTRNSIAAHSCVQCGFKFKRKPLPKGFTIVAGALVVCAALWATATCVLPGVVDPEKNLRNIAKRVAAGPRSPGESVWMLRQFNGSIERYLEKFGELPTPQLNAELRKLLPVSAFEVYVVNLPQHLKLVEVDTLLQGNSFLLMNTAATKGATKVIPVHGLEVYEDSRLISDSAGPILVLLGHSGGQLPHTSQIKVFAVLPADVSDESEKSVPRIVGEGSAHFVGTSHDIVADLSLVSIGKIERVLNDVSPRDDSTVRQYLTWADNKYAGHRSLGDGPLSALYTVAYCMQNGDAVPANRAILGDVGIHFVQAHHSEQPCNFKVECVKSTPNKVQYMLSNERKDKFEVILVHARNGGWCVASAGVVSPVQVVAGQKTTGRTAPTNATAEVSKEKLPEELIQASKIVQETHLPGLRIPNLAPKSTVLKAAAGLSREIIVDGATLRSGPSRTMNAITYLSKGQKIEVIGKETDGWYKVRVDGKQGYVYGELIDYIRAKTPARSTRNSATIVRPFNIHDANHKPITPLKVGEHVTVIGGLEGSRYKIRLPNGMTGYVDQNALDMSGQTMGTTGTHAAGAHAAGTHLYKSRKTNTAARASAPPQFVP
jgi:hypothetical protein